MIRPPKFYALFEFQCGGEFPEAAVSLDEGRRSVFWPLPEGKVRWSFEINDDDIPPESRLKSRLPMHVGSQIYPYLTREDLQRLLVQRAPWFTAEVGHVTWSLGVRFEQRLVREFGSGRVWLAGDAAHVADPVGVQSLNRGLAEGADLALRLAAALHEHAPLETLHEYSDYWTNVWRQVFGQRQRRRPTARPARGRWRTPRSCRRRSPPRGTTWRRCWGSCICICRRPSLRRTPAGCHDGVAFGDGSGAPAVRASAARAADPQ